MQHHSSYTGGLADLTLITSALRQRRRGSFALRSRVNSLALERLASSRFAILLTLLSFCSVIPNGRPTFAQEKPVAVDDMVFVLDRDTNEPKGRPGRIIDFNQKFLELQTADGRIVKIAAADVNRVQTQYSESFNAAQQQISTGDFEAALISLGQALQEEKREWVLRELLAQRASVAKLLGNPTLACESFLLIARNEPNHRHWAITPLPWHVESADIGLEQLATKWMESAQPAEQLVGSAWLLLGSRKNDAERKLRELARTRSDAIGQLATAQLWRLPRAIDDQVIAQWRSSLDSFPEELRPGPEYLLGRALAQQKQNDLAAATFLRARILHPECYELSAMCLFEAGRNLQASGHPEESQRLNAELQQAFPDSFWAKQLPR